MKKAMYLFFIVLCVFFMSGCSDKNSDAEKKSMVVYRYVLDGYDAAMLELDEVFDSRDNPYAQSAIEIMTKRELNSKEKEVDQQIKNTEDSVDNAIDIDIKNSMEITDKDATRNDGYIYITGSVKNTSNSTIRYYEVVGKIANDKDEVIDSNYTNSGQDLPPNESRTFEIMIKDHKDYGYRYSANVDEIRFK